MKKQKVHTKLRLEKLQITKLVDTYPVIGGYTTTNTDHSNQPTCKDTKTETGHSGVKTIKLVLDWDYRDYQ